MIVSHSRKFVFVKSRKTAGTTVEIFLRKYLDKEKDSSTGSKHDNYEPFNVPIEMTGHIPANQIQNHFNIPDDYYWFSIERNPWDKIVSSWAFYTQFNKQEWEFGHFVRRNSLPQSDWDRYHLNGKMIDVIKFEELNDGMTKICDQIGIYAENWLSNLQMAKKSKREHYSKYYSDELKDIIAENFRREIEHFNYKYEKE